MAKQQDGLPRCVSAVLADLSHIQDDVHKFVRFMAAFEALIKLVAASCHGAIREPEPPRWYAKRFCETFRDSDPSLGDWVDLIAGAGNYLRKSRHPLMGDVLNRLQEQQASGTSVARLCRHIDQSRRTLSATTPTQKFTIFQLFEKVVQLRNAFSHGALTRRFAKKYNALLDQSIGEVGRTLQIAESWRFVIPITPDPQDREGAMVRFPDDRDASPEKLAIGDRSRILWEELHLCPVDGDLENAISLAPLMRFESTLCVYQFANRYSEGELEYLSYKTGDSEIESGFASWEDCFGITDDEMSEDSAEEGAESKEDESGEEVDAGVVAREPSSDISILDPALLVDEFVAYRADRLIRELFDKFEVVLRGLATSSLTDLFVRLDSEIAARSDPDLYGVLGGLALRLGLYEQGATAFSKQLESGDKRSTTVQRLGTAKLKWGSDLKAQGKREHAIELINEGKKIIGESTSHLLESLRCDGESQLDDFYRVKSLSMLVDAFCRLGDFQHAIQYCDEGLKLRPENPRLNSQRLYLYERTSV